ncbi:unnamed protein product [Lymnaea stagnalis]|uniref:HAUS augmin-like complex subunit 7 n=1 Tax=Lymnaea stagnalis TaxID=6523 RepID=A0AAV2H587_LYMST
MSTSSANLKNILFKERLVFLDCPYVEDMDEATIIELLISPGEERFKILQWLFSRYDSKLAELLDPSQPSFGARTESRVQRLLTAAGAMCLCRHDDVDLIRGGGPVQKQLYFIDRLLDVACIRYKSYIQENSSDSRSNPYMLHTNTLVNQDGFLSMLSTKEGFLPKDILADVEKMWSQESWEKGKPLPAPDSKDLSKLSKNLNEVLQKQNSKLSSLQEQVSLQGEDKNNDLKMKAHTLSTVLRELRQLAEGFTQCYESNFSPWCHKPPPEHSELGILLKRVHSYLQNMVQLLTDLNKIRHTQGKLIKLSKHQSDVPSHMSDNSSKEISVSFKHCLNILEETIHRVDSNFSSKYTPVVML